MSFLNPAEQLQIIKENVEEIIPEDELFDKLKNSLHINKVFCLNLHMGVMNQSPFDLVLIPHWAPG